MPLIGAERWMRAMESGTTDDAALPVGQCVGLIDDLPSCAELLERLMSDARDLVAQRLAPAFGAA
jgi:nitronate monooxygenase